MTATAVPAWADQAWTGCGIMLHWPSSTWCWSPPPTGWPATCVHQVLLLDELDRHGCQVEFLDHPMSHDPHDQLLLQIRGAVAEYERTLIAERMRRGRQAKLRAGTLLPWTTPPFGYRLDPERPRDVAGVRVEPSEAVLVAQLFDWYLEPQATVYRLAQGLRGFWGAAPTGK